MDTRIKQALKRVCVLLGDPTRPDMVKLDGEFSERDHCDVRELKSALACIDGVEFSFVDRHSEMLERLRTEEWDLIFNLCDEGYGNDPKKELHIAALLDVFDLPYTGAGPGCLSKCYDKSLVRGVAEALGVPVPEETFFLHADLQGKLPSMYPALIKPNFGDNSMGITEDALVKDNGELRSYVSELHSRFGDVSILVQEFLPGTEYHVGLVGNPGGKMTVLPTLEIDFSHLDENLSPILCYEAKAYSDTPYQKQIKYGPATTLSGRKEREILAHSLALFERLECRDYARFDFRADANGDLKLLEVNPNPGWGWDARFSVMAQFGGHSYQDLLSLILEAAADRLAP